LKIHSAVSCLLKVIDDCISNVDFGLYTAVCFLDIEKCFDSIDHDILLRKLEVYGISDKEKM